MAGRSPPRALTTSSRVGSSLRSGLSGESSSLTTRTSSLTVPPTSIICAPASGERGLLLFIGSNVCQTDSEQLGYPEATLGNGRRGAASFTMIGQTVSHYRILGKLGAGGMGIVYDAEDQRLARRVALKFLSEEAAGDPDATRRLRREAQTIALLNHPHICTVYEVDEHDGRAFIAMERLEGSNLKTLMAKKTLDTAEVIAIATQITEALEAAHA